MKNTLTARWSKRERDVMLDWPAGYGAKSDARWLADMFNLAFTKELEQRGYDPTTLRFSVAVDPKSPHAQDKFPSLLAAEPQ